MEMSPTFENTPVENQEPLENAPTRKVRSTRRRTTSVIPRVCFKRLVQEISKKYNQKNMLWSSDALETLQEYMENYMEQYFRVSGNLAKLCNKSTVSKEIFEFLQTYCDTLVCC